MLEDPSSQVTVDIKAVTNLSEKMHRGYFSKKVLSPGLPERKEPVPSMLRRRRKRQRLTIFEICEIVHSVVVELRKHNEVAKEWRVLPNVVAAYVAKVRRNPSYLSEVLSKRDAVC
jgi:hypothetical protein